MPELPEVETARRAIRPHIVGRRIVSFVVRERRLRVPVPLELKRLLPGRTIFDVGRRAKYLLLKMMPNGIVVLHLGMSGHLRILAPPPPPLKHDHLDIVMDDGSCLRLTDPRRFSSCLWYPDRELLKTFLGSIGPEPFDTDFTASYLYTLTRRRRTAIKNLLMNAKIVAGVGNIYANEALFEAGIHPCRAAYRISRQRYMFLIEALRKVMKAAIAAGGTTLRDFKNPSGKPGYFTRQLAVYGRVEEPCPRCLTPLKTMRLNNRSTFYCANCQH
jgi:formamidopyrimidine-DNA glycosylase